MRFRVVAVLLALPLLAPVGCGAPGTANPVPRTGCFTDDDCKGDRLCHQGECVFPSVLGAVGSGAVGAPCAVEADCRDAGAVCIRDYPDGYCLVDGCGECPGGSTCVVDGEAEVCMRACASDLDCRTGYGCTGFDGVWVCHPLPGGGDTPAGEACLDHMDCAGMPAVCLTDWPGGACTPVDCEVRGCPEGTRCRPGAAETAGGACLPTCDEDAGCRDDYVCRPTVDGAGACVPRCELVADLCQAGERCDPGTGRCLQEPTGS